MNTKKLIKKKVKGYYFRIDVGRDSITGKRKQKSFGPFRTKKEAENQLISIKDQVRKGAYFKPSYKAFDEFINEWFKTVYCSGKEDTTIESRRNIIDTHLIPYFNKTPLKSIDVHELDKFFNELRYNGRITSKNQFSKEPLSESYLYIIYSLLNQAFKTAVRWKLIKDNPMNDINNKPKVKNNIKKMDKALSKEELKIFLDAAANENVYLPFLLDSYTGIRRGELAGLKWYGVDLDKNTIKISGSLYRKKGEGLKYKSYPKTESSNRIIPIPEIVYSLLLKEKQLQEEMKKEYGENFNKENYVFIKFDGTPIDPNYFTKKFRDIINTLEIKQTTLHGLRHTTATLLMELNKNPKVISDILGHSRVQVTMDFYSHVNLTMMKKAVDDLGDYII